VLWFCFVILHGVIAPLPSSTTFVRYTVPDMESLESFHRRLDGAAISTYVLIMVLVPLKLWCRRKAGGWRNIGVDDAITVVSLLSANAFFWICMVGMDFL
jgi:hypothetical protein